MVASVNTDPHDPYNLEVVVEASPGEWHRGSPGGETEAVWPWLWREVGMHRGQHVESLEAQIWTWTPAHWLSDPGQGADTRVPSSCIWSVVVCQLVWERETPDPLQYHGHECIKILIKKKKKVVGFPKVSLLLYLYSREENTLFKNCCCALCLHLKHLNIFDCMQLNIGLRMHTIKYV